jgi:hypothetical protein
VCFFERGGRFVRYETRECSNGQYELTILDPDGREKIEMFDSADSPPRKAFRDTRALPSSVRGPVDFSHGSQRWICCDCFVRRASVQPVLTWHQ